MPKTPSKPPFWRRGEPDRKNDISLLRSENLPKGQRFETVADAHHESERSQRLLTSFSGGSTELAEYLRECRAGDYHCNETFCPICARVFRRWLIGELLRVTRESRSVRVYTVLLQSAPQDKINDLDPSPFRHVLRKRLKRAGLGKMPVIGGFEIVYKAKKRAWVLHANLMTIGGKNGAHDRFKEMCKNSDIERPIIEAGLNDPAKQLSYILKFSTYHRPHEQTGSRKSQAKALNAREHAALVKWMAEFEFTDFLFLVNARRQGGTKIVLQQG